MVGEWIRDLRKEFKGYGPSGLKSDVLSGITVAAVALPLALAFGVGSGADAAAGLITAILGGIIIAIFAGAPLQISGPTGAMTAILIPLVASYGLEGMFVACLMSGLILLIMGIFRLGRAVSLIPTPVITGFTSGIAVVIAFGQIGNFLGVPVEGENTIEQFKNLIYYLTEGHTASDVSIIAQVGFNPYAVGVALFCMLLMVFWPKSWNARMPASLLSVIIALVVNLIVGLPVGVVGEIPRTLLPEVRLTFSTIPWENLSNFIGPAVSIAALGMIESLLCGVAGSRMMPGVRFRADRELIAQGIGNMVIPFFGGVPATAAIARTSVGIKSGGRTRITSIVHAIVLLISMLLLAPVMSQIPLSALAGVLMITSWRMNDWVEIRYFFGKRMYSAIAKFLLTLAVTVLFDLVVAIAVGVGLSILLFVSQSTRLVVNVDPLDKERMANRGIYLSNEIGEVNVMYLSGPLFFGSIDRMADAIDRCEGDMLILSMRGVNMIDTSGIRRLEETYEKLTEQGVTVLFAAVQPRVQETIEKSGLLEKMGRPIYWSTDLALAEFKTQKTSA